MRPSGRPVSFIGEVNGLDEGFGLNNSALGLNNFIDGGVSNGVGCACDTIITMVVGTILSLHHATDSAPGHVVRPCSPTRP